MTEEVLSPSSSSPGSCRLRQSAPTRLLLRAAPSSAPPRREALGGRLSGLAASQQQPAQHRPARQLAHCCWHDPERYVTHDEEEQQRRMDLLILAGRVAGVAFGHPAMQGATPFGPTEARRYSCCRPRRGCYYPPAAAGAGGAGTALSACCSSTSAERAGCCCSNRVQPIKCANLSDRVRL